MAETSRNRSDESDASAALRSAGSIGAPHTDDLQLGNNAVAITAVVPDGRAAIAASAMVAVSGSARVILEGNHERIAQVLRELSQRAVVTSAIISLRGNVVAPPQ